MNFKYLLAYVALSAASTAALVGDVVENVSDIYELTSKVFDLVEKTWDFADKMDERLGDEQAPVVWYTKKKERKVISTFGRISQLMQNIQRETDDVRSMMFSSLSKLQSMPDVVLNGMQINVLLESVRSIENDFKTMKEYNIGENTNEKNVNPSYSSYTLEKFAEAMLSFSLGSPRKQMANIHSFIVPEWDGFQFHTHGGIFNVLKHTMEGHNMLCDKTQSLQQLIYNLYTTLHVTQVKGFAVMQVSWMLLNTYGKGNFTVERINQKSVFDKRISEQSEALKNVMSSASNVFWKCDPEKHIKDKTYLEVTRLLQGYIENESDMNYEQSCMQNCAYYNVADHKTCHQDQFCAKQHTCNGQIMDCRFIDSDMRVCQSPFGSNRRYEYIAYKNGKVLGDSSVGCKGSVSRVDSWWVYLVWHCSYCFCICESGDAVSDRYFSLQPALSNIDENKIVTGLRFIKVNNMFHLQVQEGYLGVRGGINETTRHWVKVPGPEFSYKNSTLKDGVDYHKLKYTARTMDLDNVIAPENMVITGVKFRLVGSHLNLEARVTPFNFITGELIEPKLKSYWIGNDNTEHSNQTRIEIDISNLDLPTKSHTASEPNMESNKFLSFTYSSVDHDVAQTTLPFIDMQPVVPYPGVPLSGVGTYYKGIKSYGGFIGSNVFTYDYSKNINADLFAVSDK